MRAPWLGLSSVPKRNGLACLCAWLVFDASLAYAQVIPRYVGANRIGVIGEVGNTSVSRNTDYFRAGAGNYGAGAAATGNYLGTGGAARSGFGGRAGSGSPLLQATTGGGMFVSPRGRSGFARLNVAPLPSGTHLFTTDTAPLAVKPTQNNASLLHRMILTSQLGNTAPARRPKWGLQIRDELSQTSLDNASPPEQALDNPADRRSYSEVLAERIAAEHARAIARGWEFFLEGEYHQAIRQFESAEISDPHDAEAAVGVISSAVVDGSHGLAGVVLLRAVKRGQGLFDVKVDLQSKHSDPEVIRHIVVAVSRSARQNPENVNLAATSAFLLWFSGQDDEALRIAERIYEEHRTSPFASMAAQMRGESVPAQDDALRESTGEFAPLTLEVDEGSF